MAYEKHTWVNNETITAAKMNNIETGIEEAAQSGGGGVLIVTSSFVNGVVTMDKTAQEIYDAFMSGTPVYYQYTYGGEPSTAYNTHTWLAPVTYFYTYGEASNVRIGINRPKQSGDTISSITEQKFIPSVITFKATSMNSYPILHATVWVSAENLLATTTLGY